tara:strand:- start:1126 stop:1383 length:258 start_codon:yes stop_codon:yes gene_type:complete
MKNSKQYFIDQSIMLNKSMAWWENEILEVTQFLETIDNSNVRKSVLEQTKSTHKALFARGNIEIGICENLDAEIKDYFKNEKKKK